MVFAHDKGRLCNNVLQYAHVYAWGREHGRSTMSMRFAYKYRYFHLCHTRRHNIFAYVWAKYASQWGLLPVARFEQEKDDYSGEEALMLRRKNIVVEGWYARWPDLFVKYKQEIVSLFAFDERVKVRPDRLMASLPACDLRLGVHVRRGDYRTFHGGRFFYTDEQYIALVRQFLALHPGRRVQVFVCGNERSLDRSAYREALTADGQANRDTATATNGQANRDAATATDKQNNRDAATVTDVSFPCGNPGEDLYLLSQCDFLIGPPSTFSLVASMYRDVPLCWVKDIACPLAADSFERFDTLFRNIL